MQKSQKLSLLKAKTRARARALFSSQTGDLHQAAVALGIDAIFNSGAVFCFAVVSVGGDTRLPNRHSLRQLVPGRAPRASEKWPGFYRHGVLLRRSSRFLSTRCVLTFSSGLQTQTQETGILNCLWHRLKNFQVLSCYWTVNVWIVFVWVVTRVTNTLQEHIICIFSVEEDYRRQKLRELGTVQWIARRTSAGFLGNGG